MTITYEGIALILFCTLWRPWLGGLPVNWPFGAGLTATKYVIWLAAIGGYAWHATHDWRLAAFLAITTLAMWRALPQALDSYPLLAKPSDPILKLMGIATTGSPSPWAWWAYALVRYGIFAAAIVAGLILTHRPWYAATILIAIGPVYRVTWALRNVLPYNIPKWVASWSSTPDMNDAAQHYHFAEVVAGALTGASIVLVLT